MSAAEPLEPAGLYGSDCLLDLPPGGRAVLVESMTEVNAGQAVGLRVVCAPGHRHRGEWLPRYTGQLAGLEVACVPSIGWPGGYGSVKWKAICREVATTAAAVKLLSLPSGDASGVGDLTTFLRHHSAAEFERLAAEAEPAPLPHPGRRAAAPDLEEPFRPRPFPADALPPELRDFAMAAAREGGFPAAFVAWPGLSVLAAASGGRLALQVGTGFIRPPIIWTCVVAPPGAAKTIGLGKALAPLDALGEIWDAEFAERQAEYHRYLGQLSKGQVPDPDRVPAPGRRAVLGASTLEALAVVVKENPGHGLIWSQSELSAIISSLDQYHAGGRGAGRAWLLQLWDGLTFRIDRRTWDGPVVISHPLVSLTAGTTPELAPAVFTGSDGLVARFLATYHPEAPLAIFDPHRAFAPALEGRWAALVRQMVEAPRSPGKPPLVTLEGRAIDLWNEVGQDLTRRAAQPDVPTRLRESLGKTQMQLAATIGTLHSAAHPDGVVPPTVRAEIVERAWLAIAYSLDQARLTAPEEPSAAADRATRELDVGLGKLVAWLQGRPQHGAARRTVQRVRVAGCRTPGEVNRLLTRYEEVHPGHVLSPDRRPGGEGGSPGTMIYAPGWAPTGPG